MNDNTKIKQFIKFAFVGVSNTIVSYIFYVLILLLLQEWNLLPDIDYLISQWVSYVLSIFWAFFLNRKYVFNSDKNWFKSLIESFISYSFTGIFLSSILLYIEVDVWGWSKVLSPIVNIMINVPINFLMNKYWAFEDNR